MRKEMTGYEVLERELRFLLIQLSGTEEKYRTSQEEVNAYKSDIDVLTKSISKIKAAMRVLVEEENGSNT